MNNNKISEVSPMGFKPLTEEQWYRMSDAGAGEARALPEFDVTKSFVYDREYGIFPVNGGYHQQAMAQLYAFHHGFADAGQMIDHLKSQSSKRWETSHLADLFIEKIPGTAFRSSVGKCVVSATRHSLTPIEKRIFGELKYTLED
jgi:hypothetical protein